ncbi:MAG TPA: ABC transporter permease [Longimicrobiales bacterium]|jgi:predicted permease
MGGPDLWVRLTSLLVPGDRRDDWIEEWRGELAASGGTMADAWGALADAWYLRMEGWTMDAIVRDLRAAVRSLVRKPFFTALAGVTLAVGIGANTAIFSVVDGVLINPLPFPDSHLMVSYNFEAPGLGVSVPVIPHSEGTYLHYLENATSIESLALFSDGSVNLVTDEEPRRLSARVVTEKYFDAIGLRPFLGRGFLEGEDRLGAEPVAVLGYGLWEESFGKDPSVVGRLVEMDGVQRRVVGVMGDFSFLDADLWIPMAIDDAEPELGSLSFIGVARLVEGVDVEAANTEMQGLLMRFSEAHPEELGAEIIEQAGLAADVKPLKELFVQDVRPVLWVLLGTVGFVLLIACANVANLFLVRAESRQREQAVRTALGASRGDVMRQYLSEALALAVGAGVLGLGLAAVGVRGLLELAPADLPQALSIGIDGSVLAFTAVISLASGVLFGLFPVLGYGRRDLSNVLKEGGRASTTGRERHRARSSLVVSQVALALVLLVGSGLMLKSFVALRGVDPGFESEGVLTFRVGPPDAEYPEPTQVLDVYRRLADRLTEQPGVQSVGMIDGLPLSGAKSAGAMEPEERPYPEGELGPIVERRSVTPGYFETMRIPLAEGRPLEWSDQGDQHRGVVISEALAQAFWPGQSALGRMIRNQGAEFSWEVVGVAADVRFDDVADEPLPMAYFPVVAGPPERLTGPSFMDVAIRVGGDPLGAVAGAREALRAVDPRLPIINPRTVESIVNDSMASTSFTVLLLGIAAGIALLLGTVGIYGVISYIVSRRTQEIGVRMALGAPAATVLRAVVGQGMALTGIGVGLGLLGAWGVSRVLASLLYGVTATDPVIFAGTAALLTLVALLATWIPARRASRVDPVEALRTQ